MEKYCRAGQATDDNIICPMRIPWWIPKATNTFSEYVIVIVFPLPQLLHERASSVTLYVQYSTWPVLVIFCQLAYRVEVAVAPTIERHTRSGMSAVNNKRNLSDKKRTSFYKLVPAGVDIFALFFTFVTEWIFTLYAKPA